jgi:copper chaperone CopZ
MTCAFAVRGALKKLPGVESVDVSLNKGLAAVKLKPGNSIKPEEAWETVRKTGFTPKETKIYVRGAVQAGKLRVTGTNQLLDLAPDPKNPKVVIELSAQAGKTVIVQGTLTPAKDLKAPVPLQVRAIEKGN